MAQVFDIALDSDLDIAFDGGDFVIAETTEQHMNLLLVAAKGSFTESPAAGVALQSWLNDETGSAEVRHAIQKELEADGMTIEFLSAKNIDQIQIVAGYE